MSTDDVVDLRLTTWAGSRREQLRRWAALPLAQIIQAIEDAGDVADYLSLTNDVPEVHRPA